MDEVLKRLVANQQAKLEEREDLKKQRTAIVEAAKVEERSELNDTEDAEFRALSDKIKTLDGDIEKLGERIAELTEEEERSERVAKFQSQLGVANVKVNERRTYEPNNGASYFRDLALTTMPGQYDHEARARLERHAVDVATAKEYRDLNRTDGTGGYFVPPAYLMSQFIDLARAGRTTANIVTRQQLPAGTDSINIPKLATGTATAIQSADNAAVQETDATDSVVTAAVKTIAGQQDVSLQLLEQSPVNFDEIIFRDLVADYNTKLNVQVLDGSGAAGQVTGILNTSSITTVTYTDASPTVPEFYSKVADAIQQVHTNRYLPPTAIVMHPRRWAWLLAAVDGQNRPLVVPNASNPMNAMGTMNAPASEGPVGTMQGLNVYVDSSIPTTDGAGTNEDVVIVARVEDLILWESGPRTRTLADVGSGTLTVRLQVYGYVAFTGARFPKSISVISGTGLVAPTF